MTAFIKYGSFEFIGNSGYPVPSISISQEYQRDGAGRQIGLTASINLEGKIYSGSGDNGFRHLMILESGLRNIFSYDGNNLIIGCSGQTTNLTIFSGIKVSRYNANKTENNWTTTIDYSIDLQSEIANTSSGIFYVSNTQDDWNIETIDESVYAEYNPDRLKMLGFGNTLSFQQGAHYPFYRISRTIGAVGKFVPTSGSGGNVALTGSLTAVYNAKAWVNYHLPLSPTYSEIIKELKLYNFVRSINTSETEGSYRITDNWIAIPNSAQPFTESFTIESSIDNSMMRTVTINGNIKGLELFNSGNIYSPTGVPYITGSLSGSLRIISNSDTKIKYATKFDNAISGYSGIKNILYQRVQSLATTGNYGSYGSSTASQGAFNFENIFGRKESRLHPIPLSITEGFNPAEGSITYSWSYNNRPLNYISGSISETLNVDDTFATPLVASIFVLGRKLGPILQDLGTITSSTRRVTFDVVFPRPTAIRDIQFNNIHYSQITGLVESFNPSNLMTNPIINTQSIKSIVKSDTAGWNITEGRFTKEKTWEWIQCQE
jgi:hypothetical protein